MFDLNSEILMDDFELSLSKYELVSDIPTASESADWAWDDSFVDNSFVYLKHDNREVRFHKTTSLGTARIRGAKPMSKDQHYFEIKLTSHVYGTDMMMGVGTAEADMTHLQHSYESGLGADDLSWALSYNGTFHHGGDAVALTPMSSRGCTVGFHLDLWNGTLTVYRNKKLYGVAASGLRGKTLYAMACSTAARSGMRITRATSFPSSLQFLCCAKLRALVPPERSVLDALPPGLRRTLRPDLDWLLQPCAAEDFQPKQDLAPRRVLRDSLQSVLICSSNLLSLRPRLISRERRRALGSSLSRSRVNADENLRNDNAPATSASTSSSKSDAPASSSSKCNTSTTSARMNSSKCNAPAKSSSTSSSKSDAPATSSSKCNAPATSAARKTNSPSLINDQDKPATSDLVSFDSEAVLKRVMDIGRALQTEISLSDATSTSKRKSDTAETPPAKHLKSSYGYLVGLESDSDSE